MGHIRWRRRRMRIPGPVAGSALGLAAAEPGEAPLPAGQPRQQPEQVIIHGQGPLADIPQSMLTSGNHWRMAIIALLALVTAPCWVAETRASTSDPVSS